MVQSKIGDVLSLQELCKTIHPGSVGFINQLSWEKLNYEPTTGSLWFRLFSFLDIFCLRLLGEMIQIQT